MNRILHPFRLLARNPWLPLFIGIPFIATGWMASNYYLPPGKDYHALFGLSVASAILGSMFLAVSISGGSMVVRLLAVVFLLANWRIATQWMEVEPWLPRTVRYPIPPPRLSTMTGTHRVHPDCIVVSSADASREFTIHSYRLASSIVIPEKTCVFTIEESVPYFIFGPDQTREGDSVVVRGSRRPPEPPGFFWEAQLVAVDCEGSRIFDRSICEVHQSGMERRDVPIRYGLPGPGGPYPKWEEELRLFPHHREYEPGGCVVMEDSANNETRFVCPACKEAFTRWMEQHR